MKTSFRVLYRQLLSILYWCLLVTTLTGIIISLNNYLIPLPIFIRKVLVSLHQGAFLGSKIAPVYILLLGLGILALGLKVIIEGRYSLLFQKLPFGIANVGRIIALLLVIPLAVCVQTGVAYRLATDWFGISSDKTAELLFVHGGAYFGAQLATVYLLAVSVALIILLSLSRKGNRIRREHFPAQLRETYTSQDSTPNQIGLDKRARLTIIYASIALLGILYYATSAWFVAIAIAVIVTILLVVFLGKISLASWRQQRSLTIPHEPEAESITMLKAIPDSMLRISQEGICLSYMPPKEATSFVLHDDIINKHISEFLAPEIAEQLITSAQSSLQTGSTNICRFAMIVDDVQEYYEARITPIGGTEVLILVREISDFNYSSLVAEHLVSHRNEPAIDLLTESELLQVLQSRKSDNELTNCILLCLAIYNETDSDDALIIDDDLILQIAVRIDSLLPSSIISRLDNYNLIVLVSDRTMETASILADDLHSDLSQLLAAWQHNFPGIEFNIALLEVDAHNSDANALVNTAKITCQMAKQKVKFKTFW